MRVGWHLSTADETPGNTHRRGSSPFDDGDYQPQHKQRDSEEEFGLKDLAALVVRCGVRLVVEVLVVTA